MKRRLAVLLALTGVFTVVTAFNLFQWLQPSDRYPEARGGVLDATQWDFTGQGIIPLRGEWELYEGVLLSPEDFREGRVDERTRQLVQVPGGWSYTDKNSGFSAGTYRLNLQVSEEALYSLRAKKIRISSLVYMNGVQLGGNGRPALTAEQFVASNLPFLGTAHAQAGTVEIIVQAASFGYMASGLVQAPEFGLTDAVLAGRDHSRLADMILVTMLLVFGLYYAGMFRHWRREPYLRYFSFFCIAVGLFFSIDNEIVATVVVPNFSFYWLQKLVYLLSCFTFYFFLQYVYSYLGEKPNLIMIWLRRCIYLCVVLITIAPSEEYLVRGLWLAVLLEVICFACIFYAIFRSWSRGVDGCQYMLLGVFFLIVTWIYAQLRYELALDNPYYMIVTPLLLVFSQAFLMSERIQDAFQRSERLASQLLRYDRQKDEFLAKTSHELRTPLHGIINLSQTLLDNQMKPLPPEHRDNIRLLNLIGRRMSGLVHDILDMNRIRHGQLSMQTTAVNVGMSVRFVMEMLLISSTNREVKLVSGLPDKLPLVLADENRLRQVLHNLMENGLKYTVKGTVTISAERLGDELAIEVADTGRGISPEALTDLFEPFVQHEAGDDPVNDGLGLGLNISRELVELMGGKLQAESEPGVGSRFTFTLPIDKRAEEVAVAAEDRLLKADFSSLAGTASSEPGAEFHILIVDDEPSNLKILIDATSSMRFAYTAASSGEEALAAMLQTPKPDLVLLDLMMPGISGLDVCREIRTLQGLAELPVLMLTASGQTGDIVASFAAGANDILQKPFELAELKARMQSLLAMKSSSERAVRREMDFLQAQITPHFLYNSLNALLGLSYKDVDKLRETIHHLTTYLRAKFTFVFQGDLVPFERELELVKAYLAIEQLRFGDRLHVQFQIEEGVRCMLPPLTLQPIVENAVRHGIGQKLPGGTIQISMRRGDDGVDIVVQDDGAGISEDVQDALEKGRSEGVGIGNVNRRLQMVYGRKLEIYSRLDEGTQIKLQIPEGYHHGTNHIDR